MAFSYGKQIKDKSCNKQKNSQKTYTWNLIMDKQIKNNSCNKHIKIVNMEGWGEIEEETLKPVDIKVVHTIREKEKRINKIKRRNNKMVT